MNFFDWTQDSTIPVTKDISLLTAGFDNRNAELVWNEYYDLNVSHVVPCFGGSSL